MKFIFLFFIIIQNVYAFKYSPMSFNLEPSNEINSSLVYLENDSNAPIAIQMSVAKRLMKIDGTEDQPEENEEVEIYPSQMIIPAFEKKSVKVTYKGPKSFAKEKAFRVIAEQLPIDLEKEKNTKNGNVKILLRYVGAMYVDPGKTNSNIEFKNLVVDDNFLKIKIENKGTKHQVLSNLKLKFTKNKKNIELQTSELKNFSGENILAGMEREFIISKIEKLKEIDSSFEVKLSFDQD